MRPTGAILEPPIACILLASRRPLVRGNEAGVGPSNAFYLSGKDYGRCWNSAGIICVRECTVGRLTNSDGVSHCWRARGTPRLLLSMWHAER